MGGFNYGGGKGDGTGWSSERGDGTEPGGGSHGTGGGANSGNGGGNKDSRNDPYIRDKNGVPVGVKHGYHVVPDKPVADESHGNHIVIGSGVHAEPDAPSPNDKGNGGKDSNGNSTTGSGIFFNGLPGHPNVADGGQLGGDNRDKHQYNSIVGNNIYAVIVDGNGEIKGTFFESGNESGNRKAREEQKDKAWQQVWAYLDEKKKAEAKAAAEAKAKADAEAEAKRQAEEEAKRKAAEEKAKADAQKDARELNAERELNDVRNQINALDQERQRLEGEVNNKNAQVAHEKEEEAKNLALKEKIITPGDALSIEQRNWETDRWNDAQKNKAEADRLAGEAAASQGALNDVNRRLGEARSQEGQKQQQLNDVRAQVAAEKAKAAADAKAKADAEAKAKADAEAKRKAEEDAAEKVKDEKELLTKTSEIVADVGEKLSEHLGEKYKAVAKDIADNIKNFQGKTIRSYDDAMKSLNKITSNPAMKINKADKDAIVNAWKNFKAQDTANKLGNLGKAFNVADKVMKIEKVREKSIEGYETGNWGPLILEVESWVVGGLAASVAVGIFTATLGAALLAAGVPVAAVGIMGIVVYGTVSALVDDKLVDKLNNEIIRVAH